MVRLLKPLTLLFLFFSFLSFNNSAAFAAIDTDTTSVVDTVNVASTDHDSERTTLKDRREKIKDRVHEDRVSEHNAKVRACKEGDTDYEECLEMRSQLSERNLSKVKERLLSRLSKLSARLDSILERLEKTNISNVSFAEVASLISDYQNIIFGYKGDIESAETMAELRGIAVNVNAKGAHGELISKIQSIRKQHRVDSAGNAIERLESFVNKVQDKIDRINGDSRAPDTSVAQDYLDSAASKIREANSLYNDGNVSDDTSASAIRELLHGAHADLKSAVGALKDLKDLKDSDSSTNSEDAP